LTSNEVFSSSVSSAGTASTFASALGTSSSFLTFGTHLAGQPEIALVAVTYVSSYNQKALSWPCFHAPRTRPNVVTGTVTNMNIISAIVPMTGQ